MLKVECEGCRTPYRVDERRVPAGGLKMRCPRCGATFVVRIDPQPPAVSPAAAPAAAAPPPQFRQDQSKRTVMGVGSPELPRPPAPPPDDSFDTDLPIVAAAAPTAKAGSPAAPRRVAARQPTVEHVDGPADLPAPAAARGPKVRQPTIAFQDDVDLPSPTPAAAANARSQPGQFAPPLPASQPPAAHELDLPVVGRSSPLARPNTAPRAAPDLDLPSVSGNKATTPTLGFDLPAVGRPKAPAPPPPPDRDLPTVGRPKAATPREPGLPAVARPKAPAPPADVDLPIVATNSRDVASDDLPTVSRASPAVPPPFDFGAQLPTVRQAQADLPTPARSGLDLPTPAVGAGLPVRKLDRAERQITGAAVLGFGDVDLPIVSSAMAGTAQQPEDFGEGFGELDLPSAAEFQQHLPAPAPPQNHLPVHAKAALPIAATSALFANLPIQPQAQGTHADLAGVWPEGPPLELTPTTNEAAARGARGLPPSGLPKPEIGTPPPPPPGLSDADLRVAPPDADEEITRQAGGGVSFGELNLGAEEGSLQEFADTRTTGDAEAGFGERDLPAGDDMEFGAIPQETEREPSQSREDTDGRSLPLEPPVPHAAQPRRSSANAPLPRKKSKAGKIALVGSLVLMVGGISLSALPSVGIFGVHIISDTINASSHERTLEQKIDEARVLFRTDTANNADKALGLFDAAIGDAPRFTPLAASGAFFGYLREVRFGEDAAVHAHSTALLAAAMQKSDSRFVSLARAAEAAADGKLANARQLAQTLVARNAADIDAAILIGEIELLIGEHKLALEAWDRAAQLEDSPRTTFGRARAQFALGEHQQAEEAAQKVLAASSDHVGARILLARVLLARGDPEKAGPFLEQVVGRGEGKKVTESASKGELVIAHTLLGQIHLARSRMSASEESFAEALKLNPRDANALVGFGEVLYREGRFAKALARFEAGVQADPESVNAKLGAAKTKLALERLQEAKDILRGLREARPADPAVAYWLARVEESLGNKQEVEKILVDAIGRDPRGPEGIDLYVALAQFLSAQGRIQEADERLKEAGKRLPDSPAIHKALGSVALAAGRLADARHEFEIALTRDPHDLASLFNLGVTLRRLKQYDEALKVFDKVSTHDKNYPGLALERGVLFEDSGQVQRALEMYQEALSKAPNDPDLMLRVGSAEVGAGHASQAEEILRKVLQARPNSAEANHYMGRALLLKGNNLSEALRNLKRAAEIDPNRAEYWLYIGWASNDAGQPSGAEASLRKALDLDQSLADAYWQRGVLLRRQGAVRDAERDLLKALELKPSRYEAHAALAEAYEDQSRWNEAMSSWKKAIIADGNQPYWHYKLGRLYFNSANRGLASDELSRAVQLAAKEARPPWAWEAYLMLAEVSRTAGRRQDAIEYYRQFLRLAPPDSPFRADAVSALSALGGRPD